MTRYVIHFTNGSADGEKAEWQKAVEDEGFVLLRTSDREQAIAYARSYEAIGYLIETDGAGDTGASIASELSNGAATSPPIIGIVNGATGAQELAKLAETGFRGYITSETPAAFLLHWLKSARSLVELKSLEQTGADVKSLANETRKLIHDLSQPLAVLQGRLQLMASKTTDDDPQKEKLKTMLTMITESTRYLRELQELHRKYS